MADEGSIDKAATDAAGMLPLDVVIVTSGILHRDGELMPEKSMSDHNSKALAEVHAVNTSGPAFPGVDMAPIT